MMKGGEAHTVTLSEAAISLLNELRDQRKRKAYELIFVGRRGGMLSDMTLNKVLRDAQLPYDAHGFRSSFRDWVAEKMPHVPDPVAKAALADAAEDLSGNRRDLGGLRHRSAPSRITASCPAIDLPSATTKVRSAIRLSICPTSRLQRRRPLRKRAVRWQSSTGLFGQTDTCRLMSPTRAISSWQP
ncbi:hypothetical protein K7957_10225 [Sphingomonas yunnanensis]|nr:hypothetical protein [Sphingomonas yunnanensis]